jgi:hypothetical protein
MKKVERDRSENPVLRLGFFTLIGKPRWRIAYGLSLGGDTGTPFWLP